ncbi:MAG: hypoxanthine phosphoribosyltransferase [Chitinophagales bacterium]
MQIHDKQFSLFIPADEIHARIAELGASLTLRYSTRNPVFIVVLNGAFVFAADLLRNFNGECELYFTRIRSYAGTTSGDIKDFTGFDESLANRHVIFIEDIIDTGKTIYYLLAEIKKYRPASITTVALLQKTIMRSFETSADHIGFEIPDEFVVGYGLDYDGLGRNLKDIWKVI